LLDGIFLDGKRARFLRMQTFGTTRLRVVLQQGINRQIRRMFYDVGYEVERLVRTRIGVLRLGDLPRGSWRALTKRELAALASSGSTAAGGRGHRRADR
jgi:pseudouridine synthase